MSFVYTFGCRLNSYESQSIKNILDSINLHNVIAINTCTITNEAERQCRQKIRQLKKLNPSYKIVVTGCAAELHMDIFFNMPEVDFVINNKGKLNKNAYLQVQQHINSEKIKATHMIKGEELNENDEEINYVYTLENRSRAFVKIQDGCNHYCSFCIVPFVRGKMKSTSTDKILKELKMLTENGYKEIVLTGVDITDYGTDLKDGSNLASLCKEILNTLPEIQRLRLSSVDVSELTPDFFEILKTYEAFCPYFHISLQSGSDSMLKRMRRRHKRQDVLNFCENVRKIRNDAQFGCDIIAGFPNETEEEFNDSLTLIKEARIAFVHAFPYSKKEKTLAFSMNDNISSEIKKERVKKLNNAGNQILKDENQNMLNKTFKVIVELNNKTRCANFMPIIISEKIDNKQIIQVKATQIIEGVLHGAIIN